MQDPEWKFLQAFVNRVLKDAFETEANRILESRRKAREQRKNMYFQKIREQANNE
jgi:hypothetical protein